jgi:hypothetical protein
MLQAVADGVGLGCASTSMGLVRALGTVERLDLALFVDREQLHGREDRRKGRRHP